MEKKAGIEPQLYTGPQPAQPSTMQQQPAASEQSPSPVTMAAAQQGPLPAEPEHQPQQTEEPAAAYVKEETPQEQQSTEIPAQATLVTAAVEASANTEQKEENDFEKFTAAKIFSWLGGFALFLGAVFFVKYSIENNLISPQVRIILSIVVGFALSVAGLFIKNEKYKITAGTLCGSGIAVLYAAIYAAYSFYGFISIEAAFAFMTVIALSSFAAAVYKDASYIAYMGVIISFLVPILLSTGVDRPYTLFGFLILVNATAISAALKKQWNGIVILSFILTYFMQLGWMARFFEADKIYTFTIIFSSYVLILSAFAYLKRETLPGILKTWFMIFFTAQFLLALVAGARDYSAAEGAALYFFTALVYLANAVAANKLGEDDAPRIVFYNIAKCAVFFVLVVLAIGIRMPASAILMLGGFVLYGVLMKATDYLVFENDKDNVFSAVTDVLPFLLLLIYGVFGRQVFQSLENEFFLLTVVLLLLNSGFAILKNSKKTLITSVASLAVINMFYYAMNSSAALGWQFYIWHITPLAFLTLIPFALNKEGENYSLYKLFFILSSLYSVLVFFIFYEQLGWNNMGLLPLIFAAIYTPLTVYLYKQDKTQDGVISCVGLVAIFFITAIFPIQFTNQWITIAWALQAAALMWLGAKIQHEGLQKVSFGLFCAVAVRLLLNPSVSGYAVANIPVFNWILYTYGIGAAACFAGRYFVKEKTAIANALGAFGLLITFTLVNLEIADFYTPRGEELSTNFLGSYNVIFTYAITWALSAGMLMYFAVKQKVAVLQNIAVAMLGFVFTVLCLQAIKSDYFTASILLFNWYTVAYGAVAAVCFAAMSICEENGFIKKALGVFGLMLTFIWLNLQIAGFFTPPGEYISFNFAGNFAVSVTYTVSWALYGIVVMLCGYFLNNSVLRKVGVGAVGLATAKLYLSDIWMLNTGYRIIALVLMAVILIGISVFYQMGRKKS
ncbi:putative membrane protein [Elusimicrobium posterum]|uniref:DUF2339 domain-containing protein n=1 Tax=Elusimicrobium posterum TaxID=3116653 RepID=UPI003C72DC41